MHRRCKRTAVEHFGTAGRDIGGYTSERNHEFVEVAATLGCVCPEDFHEGEIHRHGIDEALRVEYGVGGGFGSVAYRNGEHSRRSRLAGEVVFQRRVDAACGYVREVIGGDELHHLFRSVAAGI